jgi:hypothetical protein
VYPRTAQGAKANDGLHPLLGAVASPTMSTDGGSDGRNDTDRGFDPAAHEGADPGFEPTGVYGVGSAAAPEPDQTGVYGVGSAATPEPDQTGVYGSPGATAAAPSWYTPGDPAPPQSADPHPTMVQPVPGAQQQPLVTPGFTQPQPQPHPQPQVSPGSNPALGPRRWNVWAGVAAATSLVAIGSTWQLADMVGDLGDLSFRQQFNVALQSGHLVLGVLTLLALATKTRVPTAVLTFLLGGSLLAMSGYGLYLQVDDFGDVYGTSDTIQRVLPFLSAPVPLALATMLAAFLLRVNSVQPR